MKRIIGVLIASISLLDGFRGRRHEGRCKFSYRTGASEMPSPFCLRQFLCIFPVVFRRFQSSNAVFNVNFSAAGGV